METPAVRLQLRVVSADDDDLLGWTPTGWLGEARAVEWRRLGKLRLADPFFEDTLRKALGDRELGQLRRETGVERLARLVERHPGLPPRGFVFHLSRCGSTLVSQMLAAVPSAIVVSEAPPIDAILCAPVAEEERVRWLRWMIGALGQRRLGSEQALFVKLDSWHTPYVPLVRAAFPGVPWIFVYREPIEVLVSHARQRGMHMVPGLVDTKDLGLDPGLYPRVSFDAYGAQVLAAIGEAALRGMAGGGGRLVHYRQLPALVEDELVEFFGLELSASDREAMRRAAGFHAKRPGTTFASDAEDKQRTATAELRRLADEIAGDVYTRLEAARSGKGVMARALPARPASAPAPVRPGSVKLPIPVDLEGLRADLATIAAADFVPHFNDGYYEGDWSGVALRSTDGKATQIYPDPSRRDAHADTPVLAACPHVRELLSRLQCPVRAVRFLRLGPGSSIKEHADPDLGFDLGEVRLHVVVATNPEVEFVVGGHRLPMEPGECWYHDFSLPHRVDNRGKTARTHLVIDCILTPWLRALLEAPTA
jgi:hypothetical protein